MDEPSLEKQPEPGQRADLVKRPAPPATELRASDADRDRIADILREALAEGRLTAEEHAERVGGVYTAKTVGELEPLISDLPVDRRAADATAPARPYDASVRPGVAEAENLVAVFGGSTRKGRWRVRSRTNAFALFGGVEIDLTEAVFEQREIVINAAAVFGGIDIKVPENVSVRSTGTGIFGGFDVTTREATDPDAPVVVVTGFAVFGGVEAKAKRGKRLKNLRAGS
ncbi:hypothetical protein FHS39_000542 [Streptomyces olivoverticillatus]|uniref:Cell wall-active antibiotics response LiaF-like C-terminal domain-containing protein n=1 Tax=Streptomyces olivoverticillatus TaxID=66427 RepID=A0A7W7PIX7_9ACTN|nr:hypothetical protein [Streptomyces olivoverticillatus]